MEAESLLIAALRQDSGDHVFKYLAPRNLGRLEQCLTSKLVFVPAGEGDALLHMVAGRRHVEMTGGTHTRGVLGVRCEDAILARCEV